MQLLAYGFYGGGACPSQFYWHNEENTRWYYFRYRNGHWTLHESMEDPDEKMDYDKSRIIAEGYEGDCFDGFCNRETMKEWLKNKNIDLKIMGGKMNNKILKISSKSEAGKVAGAIAGFIRENNKIELHTIGAGAVSQAIKAVAIARGFLAPTGINLICIPAFIELEIEKEKRTGIKIIIRGEK